MLRSPTTLLLILMGVILVQISVLPTLPGLSNVDLPTAFLVGISPVVSLSIFLPLIVIGGGTIDALGLTQFFGISIVAYGATTVLMFAGRRFLHKNTATPVATLILLNVVLVGLIRGPLTIVTVATTTITALLVYTLMR